MTGLAGLLAEVVADVLDPLPACVVPFDDEYVGFALDVDWAPAGKVVFDCDCLAEMQTPRL